MNFSTINSAQKELSKFENDCHELAGKVNLNLVSLAETNFSSEEKNKIWQALLNYAKNIISQVETILEGLEGVRFSQGEGVLEEEKANLIRRFDILLEDLNKEKTTILRQIENKKNFVAPLRQKNPKQGYCYFCEIDIADSFSYRIEEKDKRILGVEVNEKARFCSQECLLSYCKEYKKREEVRQNEERKIKGNIENNKKLVTEIQGRMTDLTSKLNSLERREKELDLSFDDYESSKKKEIGFFKKLAQSLGFIKKSDNFSPLEKTRIKKFELKEQLKKSEEELKKALVLLSISKQVEEERRGTEKKLLQQKERISESEQEDI
ncbi:MAG: hypothetical protein GBAus27B_000380 [Mycoplasmataceae bacterium]|nr:MAG: hypothetical protein GBAus27B_000380 [Mycoplasmataceae bacterium]